MKTEMENIFFTDDMQYETEEQIVKILKTSLSIKKNTINVKFDIDMNNNIKSQIECIFTQAESRFKHFLQKLLIVTGAKNWESVVGKKIKIKIFKNVIFAFGNLKNDNWLEFNTFFEGH